MILLVVGVAALAAPAYIRAPDLHGGDVVFAAVGDLWIAPVDEGPPRQLTASPGDESVPSFSPDGERVAYTGQYDGNSDVYVIPVGGGEPRRLTWHPWRDEVIGWTPDGKILFRTGAYHPHGTSEVFTVDPAGGEPEQLPVGYAARVAMDPASGLWALDRIGYERRTWKRYRGGMAGDLWLGDPKKSDFRQITESEYSESFPMWSGGRLFFLSDRGGTADLWSVASDGTAPVRHTDGGDWDARTPSVGNDGRIVFTRAGDLHLFDPASGTERTIAVDLEAERTPTRRRYPDVRSQMTWYNLAPEGDRVAVVARGEVFSVPVEPGVVLPVTATGARESWASYSPDGKRLVYVTDASGEEAIVTADAWGRGEPKVVQPAGAVAWHFWPVWSPDGKRIAWSDSSQTLWVAPADGSAAPKQVDRGVYEILDYCWSPDGRYLAYGRNDALEYSSVWIWDVQTGTTHRITSEATDDHSPTWDPEGRYLYFVSERSTNPLLGARDFEVVEVRNSRLMVTLLRDDVENPFADDAGVPGAEPPVVEEKKRRKKRRQAAEEEKTPGPRAITIDWDGIARRQVQVPVDRGSYDGLQATEGALFWLSLPTVGLMEEDEGLATLMAWDFEDEEERTVATGISGYEIPLGGQKMILAKRGALYVTDALPEPADLADAAVDLSGVVVELDPREEWKQIYFETWRQMRDFYWDEGMAGVDWQAVRDRYATLLPRISTRQELADLLGELIGELATSHTYVWGGDAPSRIDAVSTGLLGADGVREGDAWRITRIYHGDAADEITNPLQVPGHEVKEGEYLIALNNRPLRADRPLLAELEGKAGVPVLLTVSPTASGKGARTVVVTPTADDNRLRYVDWVRRNREYVAEKSGGKFGYVHVPDMGTEGLVAFETWFYPQLDEEGLVVDVRWNSGGYVSQLLVERLGRDVIGFGRARGGAVTTYPRRVLNGPFVVLLNEFAGSDGDIFPKAVQLEGLAPVIGTRSWGGIIGIRADKSLVDGGQSTQPEFASWYPSGGWLVENHGVDPDVVVQNLPQDLAQGRDPQLDAGIAVLVRLHAEHPPIVPVFGPVPSKSRDAFRGELPGPPGKPELPGGQP